MAVLMLLATILAAVAACVIALLAGYRRIPALARVTQVLLLTWGAIYTFILVGTSVASDERVLPPGEIKRFCGFYLDCHMGAAVVHVQRTKTLGRTPNQVQAAGEFYIVTVKVTSDARRTTLRLANPIATIVDATRRSYSRSIVGERALANAVGPAIPLDTPVNGDSHFTTPVVFDLPRDIVAPRLLLTNTPGLTRAIEGVLIGDEDSFLHKRTYFALTARNAEIASAAGER